MRAFDMGDVLDRAGKMYRGVEVMHDRGFPSGELAWEEFQRGTDIRELGLSEAVCVVRVEEGQSLAEGLDSAKPNLQSSLETKKSPGFENPFYEHLNPRGSL